MDVQIDQAGNNHSFAEIYYFRPGILFSYFGKGSDRKNAPAVIYNKSARFEIFIGRFVYRVNNVPGVERNAPFFSITVGFGRDHL